MTDLRQGFRISHGASTIAVGDLLSARSVEPEQRLLCAPAIGNNVVARADKRGESLAISQGSHRDIREGEQG